MKRKNLIVLLTSLLALSSCNSTTEQLSFTIGTKENIIFEINEQTLLGKSILQKDSFVLAVHDGNSCLCWQNFQEVVEGYNTKRASNGKSYIPFFSLDSSLLESNLEDIEKVKTGYIDLYFYKDGEVIEKVSGAAEKNAQIFESLNKFTSFIDTRIKENPIDNLYYISTDYYLNKIQENEESGKAIVVIERTGCRDCSYCIPNVLLPYVKEHEIDIPIYVVDIENYNVSVEQYDEIKSQLNLTAESSVFGYNSGFVPTYQYFYNGVLEDAGVFANDKTEYINDANDIHILDSYFDGNRDLKYTDKVLKDSIYSSDTDLNKIHTKIMLQFLDFYTGFEYPTN